MSKGRPQQRPLPFVPQDEQLVAIYNAGFIGLTSNSQNADRGDPVG